MTPRVTQHRVVATIIPKGGSKILCLPLSEWMGRTAAYDLAQEASEEYLGFLRKHGGAGWVYLTWRVFLRPQEFASINFGTESRDHPQAPTPATRSAS